MGDQAIYIASHRNYSDTDYHDPVDGHRSNILHRFSNKLIVIPSTRDKYPYRVFAANVFSPTIAGAMTLADNDSSSAPVPEVLKNVAVGYWGASNECEFKSEKDWYIYKLVPAIGMEWKKFEGVNGILDITKKIFSDQPGIGFMVAKLNDDFKDDVSEIDFERDCTPIRCKPGNYIYSEFSSFNIIPHRIYAKFFFMP